MGFLFLVGHITVREAVADACVEIDALGEGAAQCLRDFMRNARIDVAAAGRELDPEIPFHFVVDEAANDTRRHSGTTLQAASGAGTPERSRPSAAAMPPSARS